MKKISIHTGLAGQVEHSVNDELAKLSPDTDVEFKFSTVAGAPGYDFEVAVLLIISTKGEQ